MNVEDGVRQCQGVHLATNQKVIPCGDGGRPVGDLADVIVLKRRPLHIFQAVRQADIHFLG